MIENMSNEVAPVDLPLDDLLQYPSMMHALSMYFVEVILVKTKMEIQRGSWSPTGRDASITDSKNL